MGGAVKRHFLTSNFYPKSGRLSTTFRAFSTESVSKIAAFKTVKIKVGVFSKRLPASTLLFHVTFEHS
jgi:hypothetical protein